MLLRILIIQLLLIIWPPLYLSKVVRSSGKAIWIRRLLLTIAAILLTAGLLLTFTQDFSPRHSLLTNVYLKLFLTICIPWFFLALFVWLSRRFRSKSVRNALFGLGLGIALMLFGIISYATTAGPRRLTVAQKRLALPTLPPAFNGYRIAHLSDLHLGTHGRDTTFISRLVDSVNAQHPDLIVFTGDLVNFNAAETEPFIHVLRRLHAPDGIYAVLGNHDYLIYRRHVKAHELQQLQANERRMGWQLLLNQHAIVHRQGDSIAIIGSENDGQPPFPARGDLEKAQEGLPSGLFKLLLTHDPSQWQRHVVPETDIALTLAGHTHGGQLRLLGWSPIALVHPHWGGLYREANGSILHISTGLGQALVDFRFGWWPQIDILTLNTSTQ